jgi:hypothetical protein
MGSIQIVLSDPAKAETLRSLIARSTTTCVDCFDLPDFDRACVVVMDWARFQELGSRVERPERLVLITSNQAGHLRQAWDAGVSSVLSEQDSLNTVALAVLGACLNSGAGKSRPAEQRTH